MRHQPAVIIVFALISAAAGLAAPPQQFPHDSFFALNAVGFFHYRDQPDASETANRRLEAFQQAGAKWDRFDFWWGEIEPKKGRWKWDKADWAVQFYSQHGVGMLPILCYKAEWMKDPPHTEQDFREFAAYTYQVVNRYQSRVKYWEIWNEPNIPTFWKPPNAANYAKLLKAAYAAAKKADPNCMIVGAAANETDVNFLLDIARNGAADAMDVVSFHPYSMADGPEEMHFARQIENVRTVMKKSGRPDIPIWITEMGWVADINKPHEIAAAARYMVQSHVIAMAHGVQKMFWFNLQDWREGDKLEGWGLLSPEGNPKPTLQIYQVMANNLEGAKFVGYLPVENATAAVFEKNRQTMIVAWANRGHEADVRLEKTPANAVKNIGGQDQAPERNSRVAGVILKEDPQYVLFRRLVKFPDLISDLPEPKNLVVNPSFEIQDHGQLYAWNKGVFYGGESDGTFADGKEQASSGEHCGSLSKTKSALWQSYPVPALPGETYTLKAKVRAVNATGTNAVQILFLSGPGWGWKGGPTSKSVTGNTQWQEVTVTGTVPDDADVVRVNLISKENSGTVLFDDVELVRN